MNAAACFAATYREAREKFLQAADAAGLDSHEQRHPLLGHDGESLALDVSRFGRADAASLLIVTSACHGVEGFCGSAIQIALLRDEGFHAAAEGAGVAVLYLHALNPWGFSWWRRTTHENVDLNRNWHDFHAPLPANPGYEAIAHRLLPPQWPPTLANEGALLGFALRHGRKALQAAISAGQHVDPQGLFYGGVAPTWSQQALRHVLQDEARRCTRLGWIDLHTGLGPTGHGERILACRDDPAALARARAWWGPKITSIHDGSSTSARLTGVMFQAAYEECPQAEYTGIALEFGTLPLVRMIRALRADQWFENHPEADRADRAAARRAMRAAFCIDREDWQRAVVAQGLEAARQAVAGLAAPA